MKGSQIPVIPYHWPGSSDTADAVVTMIAQRGACGVPIRAVMLGRLCFNL